ncbi:MAG: S8 family serine peptidase [Thermoanaerobaculia bacterium]
MGRRLLTLSILLLATVSTAYAEQTEKSKMKRVRDKVPDEYIVILDEATPPDEVGSIAEQLTSAHGAVLLNVWKDALKGFAARMDEIRAEAMSRKKEVTYIEENSFTYLSASHATNIDPRSCDPTLQQCPTVADNRLWHLDRADQKSADPTYTYRYCTDGSDVTVYVVDTGVNRHHNEFGNAARVKSGYNATGTSTTNDHMPADDPCIGFALAPTGLYENLEQQKYVREIQAPGHGTAVASALGGRRVGIANNVTIVPIKVSRCDQFSARYRIAAHFYSVNETMFRPTVTGQIAAIYRATNSGTTAGSDPISGDWPSAANTLITDGDVVWKVIPSVEWQTSQTTTMIIDGLNWILSAENTQGPKSYAIVTLSTYALPSDPNVVGTDNTTLEGVVRTLLANNITVIASANNQNGNACDTSPARLSAGNPDATVASNVITAGGSMLLNRPWSVDISDVDGSYADGNGKGLEPAFDWKQGVRDARWICGAGDSDPCSNVAAACLGFSDLSQCSPDPMSSGTYKNFTGGSNGGPCVTLFAPAKNLFLASPAGADQYRDARLSGTLASGTSWSAPIVAGFAARVMQGRGNLTPVEIRTALENASGPDLDPGTLQTYDHTGAPISPLAPNRLLHLSDVSITAHPQSTPAALSGPTALSVSAGGTSNLAYQWYEVILADGANFGFDAATYKRGAHPPNASTLIAGATIATYEAPASSTHRAYWVRITNSCGSADSDIAVVVPRPGAPSNAVAEAASLTSVTITWAAGSGAEQYRIERKIAGQAWTTAGTVGAGTLSFTESPLAPGGIVVCRVVSLSGNAYLPTQSLAASIPSNSDIANLKASSYEILAMPPAYTAIKAQHLIELRQAVNALCDAIGAPQEYQAGELLLSALQGTTVQASHFNTMMTKIGNVRTNALLGMPAPAFSSTLTVGRSVDRGDLLDLRNALQ